MSKDHQPLRNLVIVLGDQLDLDSTPFDGFQPQSDTLWMAEVSEESTSSNRARVVLGRVRRRC